MGSSPIISSMWPRQLPGLSSCLLRNVSAWLQLGIGAAASGLQFNAAGYQAVKPGFEGNPGAGGVCTPMRLASAGHPCCRGLSWQAGICRSNTSANKNGRPASYCVSPKRLNLITCGMLPRTSQCDSYSRTDARLPEAMPCIIWVSLLRPTVNPCELSSV
jgi:hypothetical protein